MKVSQFQRKTSTDYTNLSMAFAKQMFTYISLPFTSICNKSFSNGTFPDSMNIARVIPIYKGGDRNIFSNHRP